jgi:nitroreductase
MSKNPAYENISELIRKRRTGKIFDGKAVDTKTVKDLLELAVWAPNHRLNEPWRFRILSQNGILNLIDRISKDSSPEDLKTYEKNFAKLKTAGVIIYVTHLRDPQPVIDQENFAATCAAIQNILLSATALDLRSYWGTGKLATHPSTLNFLNLKDDEKFVGWVWLGYGELPQPTRRTPASDKTIWFD